MEPLATRRTNSGAMSVALCTSGSSTVRASALVNHASTSGWGERVACMTRRTLGAAVVRTRAAACTTSIAALAHVVGAGAAAVGRAGDVPSYVSSS